MSNFAVGDIVEVLCNCGALICSEHPVGIVTEVDRQFTTVIFPTLMGKKETYSPARTLRVIGRINHE